MYSLIFFVYSSSIGWVASRPGLAIASALSGAEDDGPALPCVAGEANATIWNAARKIHSNSRSGRSRPPRPSRPEPRPDVMFTTFLATSSRSATDAGIFTGSGAVRVSLYLASEPPSVAAFAMAALASAIAFGACAFASA